jgi:Tfp pilus assembly protein PilF
MLGGILSSETFKRSERARSLLAYLVEREQAGESEHLKGYAIAIDVFGKDAEFDASTDAVVRVQAGRLRELLAQYYDGEGRSDPLRIVIPRGSYVPVYETNVPPGTEPAVSQNEPEVVTASPVPIAEPAPAVAARGGLHQVRLLWGALAVVTALLLVVFYRTASLEVAAGNDHATAAPVAPAAATPAVDPILSEAMPTIRIVTVGSDASVARVASLFRTAFAGFDTVSLIGGEYSGVDRRLPPTPDGFVLSVAPGAAPGSVLLELQNLGSGRILINRALSASDTGSETLQDKVANLATSIAPIPGVIHSYLRQNGLQSGLGRCLSLSEAYFLDQTKERHGAAYRCFERFAAAHARSPLVYSELASLTIQARTEHYDYPADASEETAMRLARKAVQLGPTSPYAHRAMGFIYAHKGDHGGSIRWMRKAYELNTFDLTVTASYGYALVFSGKYADGAAVLQRAVNASSAHPAWWDYNLFLARFMLDDMDGASRATDALLLSNKSHYLAARLVIAHEQGDEQEAEALASEITDAYPKFAADPGRMLRKANYPSDLTMKFVDALKVAGIGGSS